MSKNFLSKKSWHTGSVKLMEHVWKAEQKAEDEKRKMAILKRELQEEQKQLELKKLQEQATGKPVSERLEWMYTVSTNLTDFIKLCYKIICYFLQ